MASFRRGEVLEVLEVIPSLVRARVKLADREIEAVAFPGMVGRISRGEEVVVNTTGIELGLGTGDVGFILWNLDGEGPEERGPGHVVKLRYTPWQTEVPAAEAAESPHHAILRDAASVDGMPVVAASLHSQVAAMAAGIKAARARARVGYLMTDAGALPLAWSKLVRDLKARGLIDVTCSAGHAFGGDLEAVNVFSGLTALARVASVDVALVAMGPGGVGTATRLGFSGIEQGQILDAASALGGRSVATLRISFADARSRHRGISHHSVTALTVAASRRCTVAVPRLPAAQAQVVRDQIHSTGIAARHHLLEADGRPGMDLLEESGIEASSMGRGLHEDEALFLAAAAAGALAAQELDP